LHSLTAAKLSELAETIRVQDQGRTDLARELVLSDIGKEKMEAIRALGAQLLAHETLNVAAGRTEVYQTLLLSRIGVALLTACSLLALVMYLRQSTALQKQQREQQALVRTERDRLEVEVARRTKQLTELTSHLQTAREDERSRLARDLHDELGALLTSAKLDAARIRSRLAGTAPEAQERLAHLVETLNSGIALKRRIIEDLRPSALSNLGLVATLEILAREFADQSGLRVHCALEAVALEADAELVVYRLVQEAITNIAKYARAGQVWLTLATRDDLVEVSVRDDGAGFDTTVQPSSAHGLVGMRYRVEAEGGTMAVVSAPGAGTQIQVWLPQSLPQPQEAPAAVSG
jgi:signal transduction histidine kinase